MAFSISSEQNHGERLRRTFSVELATGTKPTNPGRAPTVETCASRHYSMDMSSDDQGVLLIVEGLGRAPYGKFSLTHAGADRRR
jgi:hypothetical protein